MKNPFIEAFCRTPLEIMDGAYYFGSQEEGDQFSEEAVLSWRKDKWFEEIFHNGRNDPHKDIFSRLARKVVELNLPYMEIACGPGLGLSPFIINKNPKLPSLVTDASPYIVKYWNAFIKEIHMDSERNFASFDNCQMPLFSESIDVVTSFLGIGSTRRDGPDGMNCINEIYRVLKHGGYLFTIENEIDDFAVVEDIFRTANRKNYYKDPQKIGSLKERLEKAGFTIIEMIDMGKLLLNQDDCELGEWANHQGKNVYWAERAFVAKK